MRSGLSVSHKSLAILSLSLFSCVQTMSTTETVRNNDQQLSAVDKETVAAQGVDLSTISPDAVVQNSIILNAPQSGLAIVEELALGTDKYLLRLNNENPLLNVLTLSNPPRLVIDVIGAKTSVNQELAAGPDAQINSIRLGSHEDKLRVVLDLKNEEALKGQLVEAVGGDVVISIPVLEDIKSRRLAMLSDTLPSESQTARAQLSTEDTENKAVEIIPTDKGSYVTSGETTEGISRTATSVGAASLVDVDFTKTTRNAGEVKVTLSEAVAFELQQTSPSEFVLHLPGVKPSDKVLAPMISTKGEDGIRSVRVTEEGNATLVRMFVDAGVSLSAIPRNENIILKASDLASARAQLADPKDRRVDEDTAQANPTGLRSSDGSKNYTGRLISLDLQDTDIDNALRIIAEVSNLNIIASEDVAGKVTLRLIDVPWDQALDVILKTNGLDQVTEGNVIRIAPVDKLRLEREALREAKRAAENLEDLSVKYVRVSYARAEEVREKVEAVITERGTVTADERTNQLIIKDIQSGQTQAAELLAVLDLRTPQVLLETQIVEGARSILRDLGFQWNFSYVQSPETGNSTGLNFPNSVSTGGGASDIDGNPWAVNFPAAIGGSAGSAVTAVLDSADGSRLLGARLSALESEGKAKVISRPQVATLNNKQAKISSVTTVRIRTPSSGTTVATGAGASAGGGGVAAFQEFNVGIELEVTPQASPDHYVLMDVNAISSTFTGEEVEGIPNTREREATSTILVKSGQTFALGGVYRIEDGDALQGVPFLKDIPFLGALFRGQRIDNNDEELIFFITPHIVEGSFDAAAM